MARTTFAYALYQQLPPEWRFRLKEILGAGGHGSNFLNAMKAKKDALGKRRLDRVIGNVIEIMHSGGIKSLRAKNVLDFGAGYIMADSLCFYLLGAEKVTAVDLNPIASDRYLALAFAKTDWPIFTGLAFAAFPDAAADFDNRRAALKEAVKHGFPALSDLGITYRAPVDYAARNMGQGFDITFSTSVLEHLSPTIAGKILTNLYADLNPGGVMAHAIHLDDHLNIEENPYGFLAADTDYDPAQDFDQRGNRIRPEGWRKLCAQIGLPAQLVNITYRSDAPRPRNLLPEFAAADPMDVFASWATLVAEKPVS